MEKRMFIISAAFLTAAALLLFSACGSSGPGAVSGETGEGGNGPESTDGNGETAGLPEEGDITDPAGQDANEKRIHVAVTIDDGPSGDGCGEYLKICRDNGIALTFFLIGSAVEENSAVLGEMVDAGCELANHSWSHPQLTGLDDDGVREEIRKTTDVIAQFAPSAEVRFVRAPYFDADERVCADVNYPLIGVTHIEEGEDYEKTLEMLKDLSDGDIVLLHCWNEASQRAFAEAVPALKKEGVEFLTVSGLFEVQRVKPKAGYIYDYVRRNAAPDYESTDVLYENDGSGDVNLVRLDAEKIGSISEDMALGITYEGLRAPVITLSSSGSGKKLVQVMPSSDDRETAVFTREDLLEAMETDDLSGLDSCMFAPNGIGCSVRSVEILRKTEPGK